MNRFVSYVVLALAAGIMLSLRRQSQRRRLEHPRNPSVPVQTWEGEGGALPATGAQMGPDPVVTASDEAVRREEPRASDDRRAGSETGVNSEVRTFDSPNSVR